MSSARMTTIFGGFAVDLLGSGAAGCGRDIPFRASRSVVRAMHRIAEFLNERRFRGIGIRAGSMGSGGFPHDIHRVKKR